MNQNSEWGSELFKKWFPYSTVYLHDDTPPNVQRIKEIVEDYLSKHNLLDRRISFDERNAVRDFINRRFAYYSHIAGKSMPINRLKPLFDCIGLKCESTGRHGSRQYIISRREAARQAETPDGTEIDL